MKGDNTNAPRAVPVRNAFTVLKYANQSARLYGVDVSGKVRLAETGFGTFGLEGTLAWSDGENTRTGDGLYHRMPLNAKLARNLFTVSAGGPPADEKVSDLLWATRQGVQDRASAACVYLSRAMRCARRPNLSNRASPPHRPTSRDCRF